MPEYLHKLIEALKGLPGVGERTAARYAMHILKSGQGHAENLASAIIEAVENTLFCSVCQDMASTDPCELCTDETRDKEVICVVEQSHDLAAIEKSGAFKGMYHVLHGTLSPREARGPDSLRIKELLDRVDKGSFVEVIIATNPSREGEATAAYLKEIMADKGLKITRIATGIPRGADIEFIDKTTLTEALKGRRSMD